MANILFESVHSVLEHDEIKLFTELGHTVFSLNGAYQNFQGDGKRPPLNLTADSHLTDIAMQCSRENIHEELIHWADIILVMHRTDWIKNNWDKMKDKRVILRTIGQNTESNEKDIAPLRAKGLKIVRMSESEKTIPNYQGEDAIIPFYEDEDEFYGYTGQTARIVNVSQAMFGNDKVHSRGDHMNIDAFRQIVRDLPWKIYGSDNEYAGENYGGELSYEDLKTMLRFNRVFLYMGTIPSPYTLAFIEAMMCFPPETLVDSDTKIEDVLEKDYEGDLITIETTEGKITCTPNHPFLTNKGFTKAENLCIMDSIYTRQDTYDKIKNVDKRRIGNIVKKFQSSNKNGINKTDSYKDLFFDIGKKKTIETSRNELKYFRSNEIFFDTLRDMLLSGNNRWGGNLNFQGQSENKKNISFNKFINDSHCFNRLVEGKIQRSEKSRLQNKEQEFRETKNSLYVLLERMATFVTFGGIETLSLNQKRALWNTDFFYQKPSESKIQSKILSIRNGILEKDKTIKQARIIRISKKPYKGKVYNLSTSDGVYWANNFLVHNTGIPVVALGESLLSSVYHQKTYDIPKIIIPKSNGFFSDSIDEIRAFLKVMLDNPNEAKKVGQAGRATAINLFGKRKVSELWRKFLNE